MRFAQTREILQNLAAPYHRSISSLYSEFSHGEVSPRNRLMLEYLIDHELRLALAIHDYMESAPESAIEYWFKRIEIPFPTPDHTLLTDGCRVDLDQLVGVAIRYKTALIGFYDHLLLNCVSDETEHLFKTLKGQEELGMKRFIRHAQGLADL
ncbi:MAG: aminoglycoside phosphotransferase [Desulfuromonadaceae bacterium]|nr:aminoglycoside phosphotransferase [Desulfuromonadaceae bacterium]